MPAPTTCLKQACFEAVPPAQPSTEIAKGAGGLGSVSRSSFMFDIVHKLFSLPMCGSGGVSVGWIGLSEAEVRPVLLIISWTKIRAPAWEQGRLKKK